MKDFVTYVHSINSVPFYVGSGRISRAYDKDSRNNEWNKIVNDNNGQYEIEIIFRGSSDDCTAVEQDYLDRYFDDLCNKAEKASTPIIILKTPTLDSIKKKLGVNIRLARKKRKLTTIQLSERANIDRTTLYYIEKGIGNVGFNAYLNVLFALGFHNDLGKLGEFDELGNKLMDFQLLKRQ
jgi:DNA-binding XRE family transcriptional regulator